MGEKIQFLSRRKFMVISSTVITSSLIFNLIGHIKEAKSAENNTRNIEKIYFITNSCIGCQTCKSYCPQQAIRYGNCKNEIDQSKCIHCGTCYRGCPISSISETKV